MSDFTFAFRLLRKSPGFTCAVVGVLALGIGATTSIFSVVDQVLVRGVPFPDPDRLFVINETDSRGGLPSNAERQANYQRESRVFEDIGAAWRGAAALTGEGEPRQISIEYFSANLFTIFGVQPLLGRTFLAEEDRTGAEPVVILGERLWRDAFGADVGVLGKSLTLDEKRYRVIGVMGDRANGLAITSADRVWLPLGAQDPRTLYGRLRRDTSPTQARAAIETVAKRMGFGIRMTSLPELTYGEDRPQILMMLGAVVLVLLIACADVANLLLARSARRVREMTVRAAIGASRGRLVRQTLVESLVLAVAGGIAGVWLAKWLPFSVVLLASNRALPPNAELHTDVLVFAAVASITTALLCGILPALQASRTDVSSGLKDASRGAIGNRRSNRWRSALVVAEIALSLTLLAGAASLIQSFLRLRPANPGFEIENRVVLTMQLSRAHYKTPEQQANFASQSIERLAAMPGVQHAALSDGLPISGYGGIVFVIPEPGARGIRARYQAVTADYFAATGTPLFAGRPFNGNDRSGAPVAIVNQAFAKRFLNGAALGRTVALEHFDKTKAEYAVIGLAGDVKLEFEPVNDRPMVYLSFDQRPSPGFQVVLMTAASPESIGAAARRELAVLDPTQPVRETRSMRTMIDERGRWATNRASLMSGMAGLALLLAAMGIYAVMSCAVAERTREIGIRVALGARRADVLRAVARQGVVQLACGLALGLFGAWGGTRLLVKNFYQVFPVGTGTFALAAAGLIVIAALATILPARRALRVDPLEALRYE
jgi:putative ABC transport system permease protein